MQELREYPGLHGAEVEFGDSSKNPESRTGKFELSADQETELEAKLSGINTSLAQLKHLQQFAGREEYGPVQDLPGLVERWKQEPENRREILVKIAEIVNK